MDQLSVHEAAHAIRGAYLEWPGLRLTCDQVQRTYSLDAITAEAVMAALVDALFLTTTNDGHFIRRNPAVASPRPARRYEPHLAQPVSGRCLRRHSRAVQVQDDRRAQYERGTTVCQVSFGLWLIVSDRKFRA